MKRINTTVMDSSQHWLFYSYVEHVAPISSRNDKKLPASGTELRRLCPAPWMTLVRDQLIVVIERNE